MKKSCVFYITCLYVITVLLVVWCLCTCNPTNIYSYVNAVISVHNWPLRLWGVICLKNFVIGLASFAFVSHNLVIWVWLSLFYFLLVCILLVSALLRNKLILFDVALHTVSKKGPTLASCSVDNHKLILIILGKQYQYTFENDMHIQLSLSFHF